MPPKKNEKPPKNERLAAFGRHFHTNAATQRPPGGRIFFFFRFIYFCVSFIPNKAAVCRVKFLNTILNQTVHTLWYVKYAVS